MSFFVAPPSDVSALPPLSFTAASASIPFADVSADAYYSKAVAWAVENGITGGIGGGLFGPSCPARGRRS